MIPIGKKVVKGMSRWYLYRIILSAAWSYRRTMWYLLRKRGPRALLKFLYIKVFVPAGEGHGGAIYFLIGSLIRRFPQLARYPKYVEIEISTVCPYKCIVCEYTYWKPEDQEKRHLSFDEFKHIVDQFPNLKWTNLTGEGSAFTNRDYLKMIAYLKERDIPVFLVDSLDRVDRKLSEELVRMRVDGVWVSMDAATKETYEKIKVGCNYDRVIQNLKDLIAVKKEMNSPIPEICVRYTLNKYNVQEMPQFLDLIASMADSKTLGDGSRIDFGGMLVFPEIEHLKPGEVPDDVLAEILKKREQYGFRVMYQHAQNPNDNPDIGYCIFWMEPYIMMGGYVVPCCSIMMSNQRPWLREHAFGSVFEQPFKQIWYSERYKRFRKAVTNNKVPVPRFCVGCRAFRTQDRIEKYGVDETL